MMVENAVLQMLNATPVEQAALRRIAMLREAGIPDNDIYAGLGDPSFTQAGGAGFLPYITDMAGIQSSYNLGRGNIALSAADAEYQRQGNPYNVVTALQNMRDTGNSAVLSDPMLQNVQQGPASMYTDYIKSLFGDKGAATAATTGQPATMQNPVAATNITATQKAAVEQQYATNPAAQQGFQNYAAYDAARAPATNYQAPTAATSADTGAQSAAARLLSGTINPTTQNTFQSTLAGGNIPGFSSLNERDMSLLSPDQQQSYMGLVGSTGRVSNPQQAYQDYLRKYSMGGSYQSSRTVR